MTQAKLPAFSSSKLDRKVVPRLKASPSDIKREYSGYKFCNKIKI
jgi:hypothetical protein